MRVLALCRNSPRDGRVRRARHARNKVAPAWRNLQVWPCPLEPTSLELEPVCLKTRPRRVVHPFTRSKRIFFFIVGQGQGW